MSRLNTKLEQLLADALLGIATAEQRAELNTRLATDDALLDEYLRLSRTDAALHFQHGHVTAPIAELGTRNAEVKKNATPILPRSTFRVLPWSIAIAAAALLTAAIVVVYLIAFTTDPQPDPIKPSQPGPRVATLIENTGDLTTPHGYPAEGDDFSAGEYTLSGGGTAEFMLTNSVNVKLRGETRMSMHNDMNVSLARGTAEFVCPSGAEGFTVHLPDGSKVVDLGTRFTVTVEDDQKCSVRVLKGSVDFYARNGEQPTLLESGVRASLVEGRIETRQISIVPPDLVFDALSVHYRADNVDALGTPGDETTTALANLADPDAYNAALVNGIGIVRNTDRIGTPFEYGIALDADAKTHIKTDYQIAGGVNKATAATWEFWLRVDSGSKNGNGPLYGEFPGPGSANRHYLALLGIDKPDNKRRLLYGMFPPGGGSTESDAGVFETARFAQLVVTKNQDTLTFYRNGQQVTAAKSNSSTYTGPAITQTLIGIRVSQAEALTGQFNIIRIYDSVLTPEQVMSNYRAEIDAKVAPNTSREPRHNVKQINR